MRAPIFVLANTSAKKVTVIITVLGITLAGCASMRTKKVIKTEDLLTKAGFQMRLADTPEKLAHLKTLPQRKIVRHQRNGSFRYVYADTTSCKCLYIGDRDAYQSYQSLLLEKVVADHQHVSTEPYGNVPMDWELWTDFTPVWD